MAKGYSLGIRQRVFAAVRAARSSELQMVGHLPGDHWGIAYQAKLRAATFCGAFPGDGWSGAVSSAVLAGCIPVVVGDGIHLPFENALRYAAFSIRIAEADVPRLPAILRRVPQSRVEALRRGLAAVRSRFTYLSLAPNELRISPNAHLAAPLLRPLAAAAQHEEDALDTLLRLLLLRAAQRRGEAPTDDGLSDDDASGATAPTPVAGDVGTGRSAQI